MPGRFGTLGSSVVDEVCPGVYVCSARAVRSLDGLIERGVGLIINSAASVTPNAESKVVLTSSGSDAPQVLTPEATVAVVDASIAAKASGAVATVWLKLQDDPTQILAPYFEPVARIIGSAVRAGVGVVVHCLMGVSRSVSLVAGYMIINRVGGLTSLQSVLAQIKEGRSVAQPQPTFCIELFKLERKLLQSEETAAAKVSDDIPTPTEAAVDQQRAS
jgi:hypothetical protein